ncbi:MAG: GC-type dockerin domain-anchored protein [Phycisphaerales bacterium]
MRRLGAITCLFVACPVWAAAPIRSASIVARTGDTIPGVGTIATLSSPFTDPSGRVGFILRLASGGHAVWYDTGVVFTSADAPAPYSLNNTIENTMGVGALGRFVYSPGIINAASGVARDGLWSSRGYILSDTDPAPGLDTRYIRFASRPQMFGDSGFSFVAGTGAAPTGSTSAQTLYRGTLTDTSYTITPVFSTGDLLAGLPVRFSSPVISFPYQFSDNGQHLAVHVELDTGSTLTDSCIVVDGSILLQEGSLVVPSPGFDDIYQGFRCVAINDLGDTLVGANTFAAPFEGVLVRNGEVVIREGDTVDGVTLLDPAAVQAVSLSNAGCAAFVWTHTNNTHALFAGPIDNLPSATLVLENGDTLDTTGDGVPEHQVVSIAAASLIGPAIDLADNGFLHVLAHLRDLATLDEFDAVLRLASPCTTTVVCVADMDDGSGSGTPDGAVTIDDLLYYITIFSQGLLWADVDNGTGTGTTDGAVTIDDLLYYLARFQVGC